MKTKMYKFRAVLIITLANLLISSSVFAQSPERMSYQAVIRSSTNALITNTPVGMRISILQGSASGTAVYVETQTPTTNSNGLVSIVIGTGTVVSGNFAAINWASGPYFIKTETDPAGGTSYTITGTSQLLSVPYALHAKTAESVTGGITERQSLADVISINNSANAQIKNVTDPTDAQDAATKAYVDLLKSQIEALGGSNLILWNKLGSTYEVKHSAVGPNGTIVGGVNFNNTVKFSKGITPNTGFAGSGVDFPTTVVDPERGCVEMWVKFYYVPIAYSYGVYGFINVNHWTNNVMLFAWHNHNSLLQFVLRFNGTARSVDLTDFAPPLNAPIHIACVWDRTGIDGTSEYMRTYVNGVKVAVNKTNNDWGTDNTSGNFRVAVPWDSDFSTDRYSVDNIKVWNYAKTTFDLNKE